MHIELPDYNSEDAMVVASTQLITGIIIASAINLLIGLPSMIKDVLFAIGMVLVAVASAYVLYITLRRWLKPLFVPRMSSSRVVGIGLIGLALGTLSSRVIEIIFVRQTIGEEIAMATAVTLQPIMTVMLVSIILCAIAVVWRIVEGRVEIVGEEYGL